MNIFVGTYGWFMKATIDSIKNTILLKMDNIKGIEELIIKGEITMTTITEDYVSFETAKLLKDLGFEQNYYWHPVWWMNGNKPQLSFEGDVDFPYSDNVCCGCTKAEALKFLREKYRLNVEILISGLVERPDIPVKWKYRIYDSANNIDYGNITVFDTYEEASEIAIKHCLKILI